MRKELGKFFIDAAKLVFAGVIITSIIQNDIYTRISSYDSHYNYWHYRCHNCENQKGTSMD